MAIPVSLTVISQDEIYVSGWLPAFSRDQIAGDARMSDLEAYASGPSFPVRVTVRPGDQQFGMPYDEIMRMALAHGRGVIDEHGKLVPDPLP